MTRHWLAVVALDDARLAVEAEFLQVCNGRGAPLRRASAGDDVFILCPRTSRRNGRPHMRIPYHGRFVDEAVYRVLVAPEFSPFRRNVSFDALFAPIHILDVPGLSLTARPIWKAALRRGMIELTRSDAMRIEDYLSSADARTLDA